MLRYILRAEHLEMLVYNQPTNKHAHHSLDLSLNLDFEHAALLI